MLAKENNSLYAIEAFLVSLYHIQFLSGISGLLLNSRRNFRLNRNMSQLLIESFNQKPAYKNVL